MSGESSLVAIGVKKYFLVRGNVNDLTFSVNDKIEEGFVPYGAPFNSNGWLCQAMVQVK